MAACTGNRLTVRRILTATFWFAAVFGLMRWRVMLGETRIGVPLEFGFVFSGFAFLGAGLGALFGYAVEGAVIAAAIVAGVLVVLPLLLA